MLINEIFIKNIKKPQKLYDHSTNGKFIYIRHGQTDYNKTMENSKKEIAGINTNFLDMPLNYEGINQSLELSKALYDFKLEIIFTSPMRRCLDTVYYALRNHPDKEKFKIVINPFLTETIQSTHDYSINILEKKEYFSKKNLGLNYDWSLFEENFQYLGDQEYFYIRFIDTIDENNKKNKKILKKILQNIKELNQLSGKYEENSEIIAKKYLEKNKLHLGELALYYLTISKKKPESLRHMFLRSLKFKEYLYEYCEKKEKIYTDFTGISYIMENNLFFNNEKVLVFTHSAFIRISSSGIAYNLKEINDYPEDCVKIDNCDMLSINIYRNF